MVDSAGDWLWSLLQHWLPHHILLRLAAIQRPQSSFPMDSVGWGLRDDRRFSVKTTYQVRCGRMETLSTTDPTWKEWGSVVTRSKWLAESSAAAAITLRNQHVRLAGMGAVERHVEGYYGIILAFGFEGRCSVVEAELWGFVTGMEMAWALGYRQLIIESDSADALRLIEQRNTKGGPFTIIHSIHLLCDLD
ncbi:hypothetical protein V6N12_055678 [Hibiscus sabdariffa]|uniref:RNase H type-1 domain-containing protein n=1 Tax=Hibiscus sabdariffa TaxID=183260 RepID=A0ABR2ALP3_9ROSI